MLKVFLHPDGWFFDGTRWRKDLIYYGDTICICPDNPRYWDSLVERFLKHRAYTSEKNLDWWSQHFCQRHRGITRGAMYALDPWLFKRCIKPHATHQNASGLR